MRALVAAATGRPLSHDRAAARRRARTAGGRCRRGPRECAADGLPLKTQVAPRPIGVLRGPHRLRATRWSPARASARSPTCRCAEQVAALRDPERRARILVEHAESSAASKASSSSSSAGSTRCSRWTTRSTTSRRRPTRSPAAPRPPASARGDGHRPDARARRQPAAVHAADELRRRQPRRRARDAAVAGTP